MRRIAAILIFSGACFGLDLTPVGAPTGGTCTVMDKGAYVICYKATWREPQWVGEHLTPEQMRARRVTRKDDFRADRELAHADRAELPDYEDGGYDRGHQAPAADFAYSAEAMSASFLLSNMCPQTPQLNRGPWARLEAAVRRAAEDADVWVFTGPVVWVDAPYLNGRIAIPDGFWKVWVIKGKESAIAFGYELPNVDAPGPYTDYRLPIGSIEKATGLRFFPALRVLNEERKP
jgi:endonuclease G